MLKLKSKHCDFPKKIENQQLHWSSIMAVYNKFVAASFAILVEHFSTPVFVWITFSVESEYCCR